MSSQPGPPPGDDRSVGEIVLDVSERVTLLVREEVELAKTEITEKVTTLLKGSVVGIVAGVFALLGFVMLMHAFAWLLNDLFFEDHVWLGFLIEAIIWFLIAAGAGLFAYKAVKAGSPPMPKMAIAEGKEIRETLGSGGSSATSGATKKPVAPGASGSGDGPVSSGAAGSGS
ncbi:phage holin family protein [soil metagenome]